MRISSRRQDLRYSVLAVALVAAACESPTRPQQALPQDPSTPDAVVDATASRPAVAGPEDRSTALSWGELHGAALQFASAIDTEAAHARILGILEGVQTDGTVGFHVRQIGGPTLLAHNEDFVFEPASTIKALTHFHAMRQVQDGTVINGDVVTLDLQVPWFRGPSNYANSPGPGETSCPDLTDETTNTLSLVLETMMVNSDNRTTQAARDFFGEGAIDATRAALGMASSRHVHMIGCSDLASASPNWLTLADAGRLYEAAATTYLDATTRAAAFDLMPRDANLYFDIVNQEATDLGLSSSRLLTFRNGRDAALKAGSYNLAGKRYRSVAGWSVIPFLDASCAPAPREYVWGAFIHDAATVNDNVGIRSIGSETLREPIRAGLETWAACEADLSISTPQVIGLADPLNVNQQASFTVRVNVGNGGPASSVGAIVSITATAPDDCTYDGTPKTVLVNDLANGESRQVDFAFKVTCTAPSNHQFGFTARIEPQAPLLFDPVSGNNVEGTSVQRELIAWADLGVAAWDFSGLDAAALDDFVVGQDFGFTATQTLRNLGDTQLGIYHDPAEVLVTRSLVVPAGVRAAITVTAAEAPASVVIKRSGQPDEVLDLVPALTTVEVDGAAVIIVTSTRSIAVQQSVNLAGAWTLRCLAPGEHQLQFAGSITAVDPHLLDPNETDNAVEVSRTIDCAVPVRLNIRPGNQFNWVNPGSVELVPAAVLTTAAGEYGLPLAFDAARIDPQTVRFGTVPVLTAGAGSTVQQHFFRDSFEMNDQTRDGDVDAVLHFRAPETGVTAATTELHVVGRFRSAGGAWFTFIGRDAIQVQGN